MELAIPDRRPQHLRPLEKTRQVQGVIAIAVVLSVGLSGIWSSVPGSALQGVEPVGAVLGHMESSANFDEEPAQSTPIPGG